MSWYSTYHFHILQDLIIRVETAGAAAPFFLFVFLTMCEMVPLLPTQPLYLTAGLLFGCPEGILPAWGAAQAAAALAFWVARKLGSKGGPLSGLVDFVMKKEGAEDPEGSAALEGALDKVS